MKVINNKKAKRHVFFCEGCLERHYIPVKGQSTNGWSFNNDYEKPTFKPSIKVTCNTYKEYCQDGFGIEGTEYEEVCHSFVTDGKIKYLNDCTHELKGQTVKLKDESEW